MNILYFNMNLRESKGESAFSSCKRKENGDGTTETDRPLKKARFAWQVKGKYHLKNEISDHKPVIPSFDASNAGSSSVNESDTKELVPNTEKNLEILGDYLLKQDLCALESINEPDQSLMPSLSVSKETLTYPKYIRSTINNSTKESVDVNNMSKSMCMSNDESEDQCIARWQARQMTKCFVDNTINSVIDSWMRGPLLIDIDDDRFDNSEPLHDDNIENEGILMAISAHGLQNTSSSSNYNIDDNISINNSSREIFLSPPSSPNTENIAETNKIKSQNLANELDMPYLFSNNLKEKNEVSNTDEDISSYSYRSYDQTVGTPISQMDYDTENNTFSDNDNSHFDFLDTAVSFAIQYKGLTSYGTDYG